METGTLWLLKKIEKNIEKLLKKHIIHSNDVQDKFRCWFEVKEMETHF